MTVITGKNKLDPTRCCQIKLLKENGNTSEKYLTHESKRQHGLRRQTQLKIRGCVPAYGTIKLMTWQMLCDLKPRLSATNVIQLSIGWFRYVPCLLSGPVLVARPMSAWMPVWASGSTPTAEQSKGPPYSQMLEEASFTHESQGRLNKLIKTMSWSSLCSRGMGLGLMSSFTSGDIAGGGVGKHAQAL